MAIGSEVLVRARDAPAYGRNFLTQDKTMAVANLMPISRLFIYCRTIPCTGNARKPPKDILPSRNDRKSSVSTQHRSAAVPSNLLVWVSQIGYGRPSGNARFVRRGSTPRHGLEPYADQSHHRPCANFRQPCGLPMPCVLY